MLSSVRQGVSKKTRDLLVLVILMLFLAMLIIGILFVNAERRDREASVKLLSESLDELNAAAGSILRLSRVGGSYTTIQLSEIREHLYAASRLLNMAYNVYGSSRAIVTKAGIDQARVYVRECEERLTRGQSIDLELQQLRGIIETIGLAN